MSLNPKINDWTKKRVWIVGASTGIGAALAEKLHALKAKVAVSARSEDKLKALVAKLGGSRAMALPLDITKVDTIKAAEEELVAAWGGYDLVIFMAGDYTAMRAWELDLKVAKQMVTINWEGFLNGLSIVIPRFMEAKAGGIALVSSVAGYRGLPKSLVYGPTKAALINLAETLYIDLKDKGLDVYVICPGFVKTPMTDKNDFEMPYLITPEEAADEIIKGFGKGEFEIHFPKTFTRMLKTLRHLPYSLYFPAVKKSTKL
ncbi:MAG: SDR family NAD(P)-dependent oxidoreductase [Betaproteobacteria bacterium]|nr:SDR family NAD(P)-dependent oxidoreductase [Betaproteobacteria bacterium]